MGKVRGKGASDNALWMRCSFLLHTLWFELEPGSGDLERMKLSTGRQGPWASTKKGFQLGARATTGILRVIMLHSILATFMGSAKKRPVANHQEPPPFPETPVVSLLMR